VRDLYDAHRGELGLDPWKPGAWRDEAPTPGQRRPLTYARSTAARDLDARAAALVVAVCDDPDTAGKGAVSDVIALSAALHARHKAAGATRDRPPAAHTPRPDVSPSDAGRLELVRAVLDADAWTLLAVRAALTRSAPR